jgi:hypothetical protein
MERRPLRAFTLASRSSAFHCLYDAEILHGGSSCPQDDGERDLTIGVGRFPEKEEFRLVLVYQVSSNVFEN